MKEMEGCFLEIKEMKGSERGIYRYEKINGVKKGVEGEGEEWQEKGNRMKEGEQTQ